MILRKSPRFFAILILALLYITLLSGNGFSDHYFVPKNFQFCFAMIPLIGVLIYSGINAKKNNLLAFSWLDIAVVAFYLYNAFQILITPNITLYNPKFINHTFFVVLYFAIKSVYKDSADDFFKKHRKTLITGILILISLNALFGLFQQLAVFPPANKEFKMGGSFGNPGPFTNFLVMLSPFIYHVLFNKKENTSLTYFLAIVALLLNLIVLPLSEARTAWIGFSVGTCFYILLQILNNNKASAFIKNLYFKIVVLAIVLIISIVAANYLFHYKKASASGRLFIWEITLDMIKDKPILGHGYDSYIVQHNNYQAEYFRNNPQDLTNAYLADNTMFAFNEFLEIASNTGIAGLLLFLVILGIALTGRLSETAKLTEKKSLLTACKLSIVVLVICSLFSYPLHTVPSQALFYIVLGIIAGITNQNLKFSLTLSKKYLQYTCYAFIVISIIFYTDQLKKYNAEKTWYNAFMAKKKTSPEVMFNKYKELYPVMKYNEYFLFNYGAELIVAQRYNEAIAILTEALPYINDTDIHIYLGRAYLETGNLQEAERCFRHALHIVPTKLFPKYNLIKLYRNTNRETEAIKEAKEIMEMKTKVETDISISIKHEMQVFLLEKKVNFSVAN